MVNSSLDVQMGEVQEWGYQRGTVSAEAAETAETAETALRR